MIVINSFPSTFVRFVPDLNPKMELLDQIVLEQLETLFGKRQGTHGTNQATIRSVQTIPGLNSTIYGNLKAINGMSLSTEGTDKTIDGIINSIHGMIDSIQRMSTTSPVLQFGKSVRMSSCHS